MKVSNKTIATALIADINKGKSVQDLTKSLAAYLVEERRQGDLQAILREVETRLFVDKQILYVHAVTAHELSDKQRQDIKNIFLAESNAKEVVIEETIDKSVLGGVRCETADQRLDLTVRRQLQSLKNMG